MKANELRIGNWVNDYQFKKPLKVTVGVLWEIENGMDFYERILLTEEWFLKFGGKTDDFEIDSFVLSSLTCDYRFFKTDLIGGETYWTCEKILGDTCIEYVHELQNLYFALTGTELELS